MPEIPPAYEELARHVGTDQIIWCYVQPGEYRELPDLPHIEWALDVPDDKILAIIDSFIWERILGTKAYPPALREKWAYESVQGGHDYEAYIEARAEEYLSQPPPEGGWWTALFINDIGAEGATVLVEHPIPDSWVVRRGANAGQQIVEADVPQW